LDAKIPLQGVNIASDFASKGSRQNSVAYTPVRKTERFKALVRQAGLVEYWKTRGWPVDCRPVGADDFECD
jgi:hypothetical protein